MVLVTFSSSAMELACVFFHTIEVLMNRESTTYARMGSPKGFRFNTGLAKVAVQYSVDTFVVNQTLVVRINIYGESRQLLVAANRWL